VDTIILMADKYFLTLLGSMDWNNFNRENDGRTVFVLALMWICK